jgi:DNA helicase-2/ATP-dependent DNA helicase PcrA
MTAITQAAGVVEKFMAVEDLQRELTQSGGGSGLIAAWDDAIAALEADVKAGENRINVVELPFTLSVSQIQRLNKDEQAFLEDLIRPMPSAPAFAAQQGTDFHSWVERRSRAMIGTGHSAVLPGMEDFEDEPFALSPNLEKFIGTFEASVWAERMPYDVEHPFVYSVAGRVVRGVIDAIYQEADGTWLLLDWKTNAAATADDLQLSIYRLAWARLQGCAVENVACAFYYVALDQTVTPSRYYSEAELAAILATDETIR